MDKSKIIAVALLVCIGGALLYSKTQDPPVEGHHDDDENPQPTAIVKATPAANADANSATMNSADANSATANSADANSATMNAADANSATASMQGDVTKLQIIDERVGTGAVAKPGDNLSMNYKGTLTNGKVFDQSYGREPFAFQLGAGSVIQGWDQGIVGMKVGGKRKLIIPPDLGYGARGAGEDIPPGATLIFEVELLSIKP